MTLNNNPEIVGVLVEDEVQFTLVELSRICHVDVALVVELVEEGVLTPCDNDEQWIFGGPTLMRARKALRLRRDLQLDSASTALVLELLDEIEALRSRLRQLGDS